MGRIRSGGEWGFVKIRRAVAVDAKKHIFRMRSIPRRSGKLQIRGGSRDGVFVEAFSQLDGGCRRRRRFAIFARELDRRTR